jgi:hypothetical protein
MSDVVTTTPGRQAGADKLPSGSLGLFDTTSSTLANIAPALRRRDPSRSTPGEKFAHPSFNFT